MIKIVAVEVAVVHLEFGHGAEVVVPEEDAELALLHGGRELAQAMVGQLGGCAVQELLRDEAWGHRGVTQGSQKAHMTSKRSS